MMQLMQICDKGWNIVNDNSKASFDAGNEIIFNTGVLKHNLCYYNDAYILVKDDIIVTAAGTTQVAFKNYAPFTKCITRIDGETIDDAENLDLLIPMYNLKECSSKYSETAGSLWFYSKDEATNFNADIEKTDDFKSFKYKAESIENTVEDGANGILK